MSIYEAVRVCREKSNIIQNKVNIIIALRHVCCLGLGVLYSMAGINGSFSPFGVAFVACVSKKFTVTATLGACIGYFVSLDSVSALRYTASVLALAVIVTSLGAFKGLRNHIATPIIVTGACLFVTGIAVVLSQGVTVYSLLVAFCEAVVGGAVSFVLLKSKSYLTVRGGLNAMTSKEITAVVISVSVLLSAFKYVVVYEVSFAHIIGVFLVLLCSFYGKEAGGAVVGVCCGLTLSFIDGNLFLLSFYSFGGLLSGAFSRFGRIATICAFMVAGVSVGVISGFSGNAIPIAIEAIIASVLFAFVSHRFGFALSSFFSPSVASPVVESMKTNVINKLQRASEFSSEICETLGNVNNALARSDKSNLLAVSGRVKNAVCSSCGLYDTCWHEVKDEMSGKFNTLLELKKQGVYLEYKNMPSAFSGACIRNDSIASSFNKYYSEYKLYEKTENRIKEIQSLASEQFTNVSDLLDSLCDELDEEISFDMDIAARCRAVALAAGLKPTDSCCVCDNLEKLTIEIRFSTPVDIKLLNSLTHQLSVVAGRGLSGPEVDEFSGYIRAVYKEKPCLKIVSSATQFNATGEKYSGDSYTTFNDDKGWFYAVICDGMGTGVRAAVSSSLAVNLLEKLVKGGFGLKAAINTVNTSLISKSGDECSVTLDMVAIDTYTGRVEFYKCGAQSTLVKRFGKISEIGYDSLPMGILSNIDVSSGSGMVGVGDVIVLSSDGVREEDLWQLRNALKVFDNGNVSKFTEDISGIIRRSQPEKNDDFTLLTLAVARQD